MTEFAGGKPEPIKDWYFTFGTGQEHAGKYVKITGTWSAAREEMLRRFGKNWCHQYASAEAAGVEKWEYKELKEQACYRRKKL